MPTIRERKPGVWEVRVFVGNDDSGRPKQSAERCAAPTETRYERPLS